jgi:hypothetical protein
MPLKTLDPIEPRAVGERVLIKIDRLAQGCDMYNVWASIGRTAGMDPSSPVESKKKKKLKLGPKYMYYNVDCTVRC